MLKFFLLPPVAFLLLVIVGIIFSKVCAVLEAPGIPGSRKTDPYACGQRTYDNTTTQDYEQFFTVAFFFTIMHVLVLAVATAPKGVLTLPLLYVAAGVLALLIIFRR